MAVAGWGQRARQTSVHPAAAACLSWSCWAGGYPCNRAPAGECEERGEAGGREDPPPGKSVGLWKPAPASPARCLLGAPGALRYFAPRIKITFKLHVCSSAPILAVVTYLRRSTMTLANILQTVWAVPTSYLGLGMIGTGALTLATLLVGPTAPYGRSRPLRPPALLT